VGRWARCDLTTGYQNIEGEQENGAAPAGDYSGPPITPREGGTEADQKCLAAANAANVLQILYESITDSISHDLEEAEAYAALVTAFIAAVGWEFAPIAFAIAAFFLVVFGVVYEIVKLIGSDLWDGTFTDTLKCALYECASDDGEGVVTFDWTCVQSRLAAGTDALNFDQLRLFNQLNFIIQVIGGADGLNQAGATTAITEADCSGCTVCPGCFEWDFTLNQQGFEVCSVGAWVDDHWQQQCIGDDASMNIGLSISPVAGPGITHVEMDLALVGADPQPTDWYIYGLPTDTGLCGGGQTLLASGTISSSGTVSADCDSLDVYGFQLITSTTGGCTPSDCWLSAFRAVSSNWCVIGLEPNC